MKTKAFTAFLGIILASTAYAGAVVELVAPKGSDMILISKQPVIVDGLVMEEHGFRVHLNRMWPDPSVQAPSLWVSNQVLSKFGISRMEFRNALVEKASNRTIQLEVNTDEMRVNYGITPSIKFVPDQKNSIYIVTKISDMSAYHLNDKIE